MGGSRSRESGLCSGGLGDRPGAGVSDGPVRPSSGRLQWSAPSVESVVQPACFACQAQRQGQLEMETWGRHWGTP